MKLGTKMSLLLAGIFWVASGFAAVKVGIIDVDKVLVTINEGKEAQKKLEVEAKKLEKNFVKVQKEYEEMVEQYKKQSAVLSDAGKEKKAIEIRKKEEVLMTKRRESQMKMEKMKQELQDPLVEKIQGITQTVADTKEIDMTFFKGITAPFTAKSKEDITEAVISSYDKKHPVKKK